MLGKDELMHDIALLDGQGIRSARSRSRRRSRVLRTRCELRVEPFLREFLELARPGARVSTGLVDPGRSSAAVFKIQANKDPAPTAAFVRICSGRFTPSYK